MATLDPFIEPRLYRKICSRIPILCVDMIIQNSGRWNNGKYLLVRRKNHPLRGYLWVVGGRVHLGEELSDAAHRKVLEETGLAAVGMRPVGIMSDIYRRGLFGRGVYHTVSIVYQCSLEFGPIMLDSQSSGYVWSDALPKRFLDRLVIF